jgi:hypothetical protein
MHPPTLPTGCREGLAHSLSWSDLQCLHSVHKDDFNWCPTCEISICSHPPTMDWVPPPYAGHLWVNDTRCLLLHSGHFVCLFCFFHAGNGTQGLVHTRQAIHHWATLPAPLPILERKPPLVRMTIFFKGSMTFLLFSNYHSKVNPSAEGALCSWGLDCYQSISFSASLLWLTLASAHI